MNRDVETFLEHQAKVKKCSRNTVVAYRNDLNQLVNYLEQEKMRGVVDSQSDLLKAYLLDLREKKYSPATVARKIATAKSFFKFMIDSGKMKNNPAEKLMSPQVSRHKLKVLSPAEYQSLLEQPAKMTTPEARRDVVMMELLYATGLRVSELVSLDVKDVDLERNHLRCVRGGSNREVPFGYRMGQMLKEFIENNRPDLLFNEEEALFLNLRGKRLTRQGFWQILKNYAAKAGLDDQITPQVLRHSFAMRKLKSGTDLHSLQQLLGHVYISSTKIYEQASFGMR
jgi:integrase/recombinase XerD